MVTMKLYHITKMYFRGSEYVYHLNDCVALSDSVTDCEPDRERHKGCGHIQTNIAVDCSYVVEPAVNILDRTSKYSLTFLVNLLRRLRLSS